MTYAHCYLDGSPCQLPAGKVVCVGLNYAAHVAEMNSARSADPLLFIKPSTALADIRAEIAVPGGLGDCHFETELAILIGDTLTRCDAQAAKCALAGVGVALDLTLRELQSTLKKAGHPWEKAKGWDGACAVSPFVKPEQVADLQNVRIRLYQNGELRQDGNSANMLTPVLALICYISQFFTLQAGDVVLTGTPAGVGPLHPGDRLIAELVGLIRVESGAVRFR